MAARWTATEAALEALEEASGETELQFWSFCRGPNKRPYWARPLFTGPSGTDPVGVDLPWDGQITAGLRIPLGDGLEAVIVDVTHCRGTRGGTYGVKVAVPTGWTLGQWVPEEEDDGEE